MDRETLLLSQFKAMPSGLCNLGRALFATCRCYLDNVTIFPPIFETHLERLSAVVAVFCKAGLVLGSSKCHQTTNVVQLDPAQIGAVQDFPPPRVLFL